MKLTITEAAMYDLGSIRAYTLETWGEAQEETYLRKPMSRVARLNMMSMIRRVEPKKPRPPSFPYDRSRS